MQAQSSAETLNQFAHEQEATVTAMLSLLDDWAAMLALLRRMEIEAAAGHNHCTDPANAAQDP